VTAVAAVAWLVGCGGPPPVRDVSNPDPSGKIPAIVAAAKKGDRRVLSQLVKDLDNDDPAVRFYAIEGLRRITGQTLGYHYYYGEDERQSSIQAWKQWLSDAPSR
jgi:hypothetical protein